MASFIPGVAGHFAFSFIQCSPLMSTWKSTGRGLAGDDPSSRVQAGPLAGVDAAPIDIIAAAVDDVEPPRARAGRHENEEPHGPRPRARAAG